MNASTGVGALEMAIVFDPSVLVGIEVAKGPLAAENALLESATGPGRLRVAFASLEGPKGDGELFVAKFRVVGAKGQRTTIALQNVQAWETSIEPRTFVVTTTDGAFTVAHAGGSFSTLLPAVAAGVLALLLVLLFLKRRRGRSAQRLAESSTAPATNTEVAVSAAIGPPPAGPPGGVWTPTHTVPGAGLDAYDDLNPAPGPVARLDPGLAVQVVERRGDWARIVCSNTWSAWVDDRLLTPKE